MIHIFRYLFQLAAVAAVAALAAAALAPLLRLSRQEAVRLGSRTVPLRWGACAGQRFTRTMALRAALWAAGYLAVVYAAAALYCAVSGGSVTWDGVVHALRKADDAVHIPCGNGGDPAQHLVRDADGMACRWYCTHIEHPFFVSIRHFCRIIENM